MTDATSETEMTWDEIAAVLHVPVRRLYEARKLDGAPTEKTVEAWRAFLVGAASDGGESDKRAKLRREKLREEVRRLQIANDATVDRLAARANEMAAEVMDRIADKLRTVLLGQVPGQIADAITGQPRMEREAIARRIIEEGMRHARGTPSTQGNQA